MTMNKGSKRRVRLGHHAMIAVSISVLLAISFVATAPLLHFGSNAYSTTYTVQPGDYLSKIGAKFGIPWQSIAQANNILPPYIIYPEEVLVIPLSGSTTTSSSSSTSTSSSCSYYYTVQAGDYLSKIGAKLGISWQSIAQANNIASPYVIYPGEQLLIPSGSCVSSSTTTSTTTSSSTTLSTSGTATTSSSTTSSSTCSPYYYTVQDRDYLSKIGSNLGVSWQSIAQANSIASPYIIYPNEQLLIPGQCGSSTTTTSTTSNNDPNYRIVDFYVLVSSNYQFTNANAAVTINGTTVGTWAFQITNTGSDTTYGIGRTFDVPLNAPFKVVVTASISSGVQYFLDMNIVSPNDTSTKTWDYSLSWNIQCVGSCSILLPIFTVSTNNVGDSSSSNWSPP